MHIAITNAVARSGQQQNAVPQLVQQPLTTGTMKAGIKMCVAAHAASLPHTKSRAKDDQLFCMLSTNDDCTPVPPAFLVTIKNSTENSSPSRLNGAWKQRSSLIVRRCRSSPI